MKLNFGFHISAVLLMLCSLSGWAKTVEGLYDAKVLVTSQSTNVRKQAARQALSDVLVRVSGQGWESPNQQIDRALQIADQYLYQYSYSHLEPSERGQKTPAGATWLNMKFESKAVQRVIKQAGLPLWGANRPTVLMWLAVDPGAGKREVVREGSQQSVVQYIKNAANKRGIPVILPVYDLEDAMQLPVESLWGQFSDAIQEASARYGAESVLVGRAYRGAGNKWFANWKFYFKGQEFRFVDHADTLSGHMLQGISKSAEILANAFAIKPGNAAQGTVELSIEGVNNLQQYAAVTRYLEKMSVVRTLKVDGLENNVLNLSLVLAAQYNKFEQAIKLDKKLLPLPPLALPVVNLQASTHDDSDPEVTPVSVGGDKAQSEDVIAEQPARKRFRWRP